MRTAIYGIAIAAACAIATPASALTPASPPVVVQTAAPTDPIAQQLQEAEKQQAALRASELTLSGQIQAAQGAQQNLSSLIKTNQTTISQTVQQIAQSEQQYRDASARRDQEHAAGVLARQHEAADKRLLALYVRARWVHQDSFLSYVLAGNSFSDLMARAGAISHLIARGDNLLDIVRADAKEAETAEHAAQTDADAASAATVQLTQQEAQLKSQSSHAASLIAQLGGQEQQATTALQTANSQDVQLAQQITTLRTQQLVDTIAQADQADWQAAMFYVQSHLTSVPAGTVAGQQTARFAWPAHLGGLVQPFGPSPYPFEPPAFGYPHFHTGIDIAAQLKTPVYAAADGIVAAATQGSVGYGNHIILLHDSLTLTLYGHLDSMAVKVGDSVHRGQLIGLMGSTGNSTGPHVHFEVRVNGTPLDPMPLLAGPPPPPQP